MKRTIRNVLTVGMGMTVLGLGACASKQATAGATEGAAGGAAPMNSACPYTGRAVSAETPSREYHGKTVGFCCNNCAGTWDKASDSEKTALYDKVAMAK